MPSLSPTLDFITGVIITVEWGRTNSLHAGIVPRDIPTSRGLYLIASGPPALMLGLGVWENKVQYSTAERAHSITRMPIQIIPCPIKFYGLSRPTVGLLHCGSLCSGVSIKIRKINRKSWKLPGD